MDTGPSRNDFGDVKPTQPPETSGEFQQRPPTSHAMSYQPHNFPIGGDGSRAPWPGPDSRLTFDAGPSQRRQSHTLPPLQQAFPTARLGTGPPAHNTGLPSLDLRTGIPQTSHGSHPLHSYNDLTPATKRRRVEEGFRAINHAEQQGRPMEYGQPAASPRQMDSRLRESMFSPQQDTRCRSNGCCAPGCALPTCTAVRGLLEDLIDQIIQIDMSEPHLTVDDLRNRVSPIPHLHRISTAEALDWTIKRMKRNNTALQSILSAKLPASTTRSTPSIGPSATFPGTNVLAGPTSRDQSAYTSDNRRASGEKSQRAPSLSVDVRPSITQTYSSEQVPVTSPAGQASAAMRLPTPTSMNAPMSSSGSPAFSTFASASATNMLTQDLQHQVSVKSLALQTLQREYDGLLAKLDRQRLKSAALEKKFEVSDLEIISLTDDKERLEKQVEVLERQLEEASKGRDEARKSYADQASQYMQIMDMGSKTWEKERTQLLQRVTMLETIQKSVVGRVEKNASRIDQYHGVADAEVQAAKELVNAVEGTPAIKRFEPPVDNQPLDPPRPSVDNQPLDPPVDNQPLDPPIKKSPVDDHSRDTPDEVRSLRERVHKLEQALRTVKEERISVRDAAIKVVASGDRIDTVLRGVFDE